MWKTNHRLGHSVCDRQTQNKTQTEYHKKLRPVKFLNNSHRKWQKPHYLNWLKLECTKHPAYNILLGTILHLQGIGQDDLRGLSIPNFFDSMNKHEPNQNRYTVYLSNNVQLTGTHKGIYCSYAAD